MPMHVCMICNAFIESFFRLHMCSMEELYTPTCMDKSEKDLNVLHHGVSQRQTSCHAYRPNLDSFPVY